MFLENPDEAPSNAIVTFGVLRSGSTLVYNLARSLMLDYPVVKTHAFCHQFMDRRFIITVRDFRDAVVSLWRAHTNPESWQLMDVPDFERQCQETMHIVSSRDELRYYTTAWGMRRVMLRYEDFLEDWSVLFDAFEKLFEIQIPQARRNELKESFNLEKMRSISTDLGHFSRTDMTTGIHGNHIGWVQPGQYRHYMTERLQELLNQIFGDDLKMWGYE